MGVDEALFASARAGGEPVLRLYRWDGPWLSIGYGQRVNGALLDACRSAGVGVVRRATGGGAVLHGGDLTYAVAAPEAALAGGLRASYRRITDVLLRALASLGLEAKRVDGAGPPARARVFDCFAAPAPEEICARGRKLLGSAQRRAGGAFLQHGSLRMLPDAREASRAAGLAAPAAASLAELGYAGDFDSVRAAIVSAAESALDAAFQRSELADSELDAARERCFAHAEDPLGPPVGVPGDASRERMDGR
jgi:lipoate-protein ligase A